VSIAAEPALDIFKRWRLALERLPFAYGGFFGSRANGDDTPAATVVAQRSLKDRHI
jgi:hypothetical protein